MVQRFPFQCVVNRAQSASIHFKFLNSRLDGSTDSGFKLEAVQYFVLSLVLGAGKKTAGSIAEHEHSSQLLLLLGRVL